MTTTRAVVGQYSGVTWTAQWETLDGPADGVWAHVGPDGTVGCWTYRDEGGYGPSLGSAAARHATAEAALATAAERDVIEAAYPRRGHAPLSRDGYETEARRLGVSIIDDATCEAMSGDWDIPTYGVVGVAERLLAGRRGRALRDEREAREAGNARGEIAAAMLEIAAIEERAQDAEDREDLRAASRLRAKARELKAIVAVMGGGR